MLKINLKKYKKIILKNYYYDKIKLPNFFFKRLKGLGDKIRKFINVQSKGGMNVVNGYSHEKPEMIQSFNDNIADKG